MPAGSAKEHGPTRFGSHRFWASWRRYGDSYCKQNLFFKFIFWCDFTAVFCLSVRNHLWNTQEETNKGMNLLAFLFIWGVNSSMRLINPGFSNEADKLQHVPPTCHFWPEKRTFDFKHYHDNDTVKPIYPITVIWFYIVRKLINSKMWPDLPFFGWKIGISLKFKVILLLSLTLSVTG